MPYFRAFFRVQVPLPAPLCMLQTLYLQGFVYFCVLIKHVEKHSTTNKQLTNFLLSNILNLQPLLSAWRHDVYKHFALYL